MRVAGGILTAGESASTPWGGAAVLTASGAVMTRKAAAMLSAMAASKQIQPQPRRQSGKDSVWL